MTNIKKIIFSITFLLLGSFFIIPSLAHAAGTLSTNWSGYVAKNGGSYTTVSATWKVPSIDATNFLSGDATWVGIGGVNVPDLIQAGTAAIVQNGTLRYQSWYELLPGDSVIIPVGVSAGDSVSAAIAMTGTNQWLITFTNNTTGARYANNVTYTSSLSSADWIQEMPKLSIDDKEVTSGLDNFRNVIFTNASTTENNTLYNIENAGGYSLTMVGLGNQVLAAPTELNTDGASFSVNAGSASPAYTFIPPTIKFIQPILEQEGVNPSRVQLSISTKSPLRQLLSAPHHIRRTRSASVSAYGEKFSTRK